MQFIRSYFTPLNEPPPEYVEHLDPIPINTLLQEAKEVTAPGDIENLINSLNMIYYNHRGFQPDKLADKLEIQLQQRRCLGAIIEGTIVVSKFHTDNLYTLIGPRLAVAQFNNIKDLIRELKAIAITDARGTRNIMSAICVYDKDGAYESNAVLLLRESLKKTQARFNEITTDDATILKKTYPKLQDLLDDILTKNGATIVSLFNNNRRVRNAFNQAKSNLNTSVINTIITNSANYNVDDFIYWVNDTNETTFLKKEQQQEQQQEQERQDKLLQAQQAQARHNAAIQASKDAYDLLYPDETRDRGLIIDPVQDNVKYGHDVLNKKKNWVQRDLENTKFVILYIKKTTGDDQIAQGVIQAVDFNLDNTLEGLTIKDKKYRFLKDYAESPHKLMFNSLMFIPNTDVVKCGSTGCWWYGGKKKSKRRISRKYKKKTTRRVVFSRNKKRVRNL